MKYFLHDTNAFNDDKITELFLNYGYEGVGLFYIILERIAMQEKPIKTTVLKAQLKVGKRLEKCWSFMEEIGIISSSNGETFNERILSYSESYKIKKEKTAEKVKQWRENQLNAENVTSYKPIRNPSKVKESKVKESKVISKSHSGERSPDTEKNALPFWNNFIKIFHDFYEEKHGTSYEYLNKDFDHLKKLYSFLKKRAELKKYEWSEQNMKDGFIFFLNKAYDKDQWTKQNFSISTLLSQFNQITNGQSTTKNGHQQSTGQNVSVASAINKLNRMRD